MHYARYHKHGDPAIGYHRNATSFRPGQRPHNCLYRGLTQEAVKDIDQARDAGESFAALSRRYRVAVKTVRMAYYRQSWKHVAK